MGKGYSRFIGALHFLGDLVTLNLAFLISYHMWQGHISGLLSVRHLIFLAILNLNWAVISFLLRSYDIPRVARYSDVIKEASKLIIVHIASTTALVVFFDSFFFSNELYVNFYILIFIFVLVWRIGFVGLLHYYRQLGFNYRNIIFVGYDEVSSELLEFFQSKPYFGYRFLGFFDNRSKNKQVVGTLRDVEGFVFENDVDEIYCASSKVNKDQINQLVQIADRNLIRLKLIPDFREVIYDDIRVSHYGRFPVITFRREPLNNSINLIFKRLFDICFSLFVIVFFLSWLFPLIALMVKLSSPGPVLFFQKRTGKYSKTFWCWKFRTMRLNREADIKQATLNDERITQIGQFLRKTNLDELPQFFNVLLGDMSVVGPRPHMLKHTEEFSKLIDKYMVRHLVKPGITGLSQTRGLRGEILTHEHMRNRVKIDIFYIENWSFKLDLKIISLTALNMIKGDTKAY